MIEAGRRTNPSGISKSAVELQIILRGKKIAAGEKQKCGIARPVSVGKRGRAKH
jgi:hypothetical protein